MKHLKLCMIGFFSCVIFNSCTDTQLNKHIYEISKLNFRIGQLDWKIKNRNEDKYIEFYSLINEADDTLYLLEFTYFKTEDVYACDDFIKSYIKNEVYHELSLFNNDTLYHFTYKTNLNPLKESISLDTKNMKFISGWYYYQYIHSKFNLKQIEYFEGHKDSLIRIRGNHLPELPEL